MPVDAATPTGTPAPQPQPLHKPFSEWAAANKAGDRPTEPGDYRAYGDYVRDAYLGAGAYSPQIEQGLQEELKATVTTKLGLAPEDVDDLLTAPRPKTVAERAALVRQAGVADGPATDVLSRYDAYQKEVAERGEAASPSLRDTLTTLEAEAAQALDQPGLEDAAKRKLLQRGVGAFATVLEPALDPNEAPSKRVLVGALDETQDPQAQIRAAIKAGLLEPEDAASALALLQTPAGETKPLYRQQQLQDAYGDLEALAGGEDADPELRVLLDEYAQSKLHEEAGPDYIEGIGQAITDFATKPFQIAKPIFQALGVEEAYAPPRPSAEVADELLAALRAKGVGSEATADLGDLAAAAELAADRRVMGDRRKPFYDAEEGLGKNIVIGAAGVPVVHQALLANKALFDQALAEREDLSDLQKSRLQAIRAADREANYAQRSQLLAGDAQVGAKWLKAQQAGLAEGKTGPDVMDEFLADKANFDVFAARLEGVGASVVDAVGGFVSGIPALLFDAKWAQDYLTDTAKANAQRKSVAQAFGVDLGLGQDVAEAVAPMVVDLGATALLNYATGGVAGTAAAAARSGARFTAKGAAKALTSNMLRTTGLESAEALASKQAIQQLFKAGSSQVDITDAIQVFNRAAQSQFAVKAPLFLPAANRALGAQYASVYNALPDSMTHEEKHDVATGSALLAATATGAITTAFSMFGAGGLEDVLLAKATGRQLKDVLARVAGVDDISDAVFKKAVQDRVKATIKQYGLSAPAALGQVGQKAAEEFAEEGLDEFVNTFITDEALQSDTPLIERLQQAWQAGAVGAVLGGGVPVAARAAKNVRSTALGQPTDIERGAMRRFEDEFISGVAENLQTAGAPMTAQVVGQLLRAGGGRVRTAQTRQTRQEVVAAVAAPEAPEAAAPEGAAPPLEADVLAAEARAAGTAQAAWTPEDEVAYAALQEATANASAEAVVAAATGRPSTGDRAADAQAIQAAVDPSLKGQRSRKAPKPAPAAFVKPKFATAKVAKVLGTAPTESFLKALASKGIVFHAQPDSTSTAKKGTALGLTTPAPTAKTKVWSGVGKDGRRHLLFDESAFALTRKSPLGAVQEAAFEAAHDAALSTIDPALVAAARQDAPKGDLVAGLKNPTTPALKEHAAWFAKYLQDAGFAQADPYFATQAQALRDRAAAPAPVAEAADEEVIVATAEEAPAPEAALAAAEAAQADRVEAQAYIVGSGVLPAEIPLVAATTSEAPMWESNGVVYYNPSVLMAILRQEPAKARAALEDIVGVVTSEEMLHVASRRAIGAEEFKRFTDGLRDADFEETLAAYTEGSAANEARLRGALASDDVGVAAAAKAELAEERLRQHAQQLLYGVTTEATVAFYRATPAARPAALGYFKGMAQRLLLPRRLRKYKPAERVLLSKVIHEAKMLRAGYRPAPEEGGLFTPDRPNDNLLALARTFGAGAGAPESTGGEEEGQETGFRIQESGFRAAQDDEYAKDAALGDANGTDPLTAGVDLAEWAARNPKAAARMAARVASAAQGAGFSEGPLLHGTNAEFTEFQEPSKAKKNEMFSFGFHFTNSPELAGRYGEHVVSGFLKLRNPLNVEKVIREGDPEWAWLKKLNPKLKGFPDQGGRASYFRNELDALPAKTVKEALQAAGYDGLFYKAKFEEQGVGYRVPLAEGDTWVALEPSQIKSADYATFGNAGNLIPLAERFQPGSDDIRFAAWGAASELPAGLAEQATDYTGLLEATFRVPLFHVGPYEAPTTRLRQELQGPYDPRFQKLLDQNTAFQKTIATLTEDLHRRALAAAKAAGGASEELAQLLNEASGSSAPLLTGAQTKALDDSLDAALAGARDWATHDAEEVKAMQAYHQTKAGGGIKDPDKAKRKAHQTIQKQLEFAAFQAHREEQAVLREEARAVAKAQRDLALGRLAAQSPELARLVVDARVLVDEMSRSARKHFDGNPALQATFDANMGLYLTRSYRFFEEADYQTALLDPANPEYEPLRQAAVEFFEEVWVKDQAPKLQKKNPSWSPAEAEAEARRLLATPAEGHSASVGQEALWEYLQGLARPGAGVQVESKVLKVLQKNLKQKKDVPPALRALLGEQDDSATGFNSLLRSLAVTSALAGSLQRNENIRTVGVENGWLLTPAEWAAKPAVERGGFAQIVPDGTSGLTNPLAGLYAPVELIGALREDEALAARDKQVLAAQDIVSRVTRGMAQATGMSMALKTLGSIGYYSRNIVGKAFEALAQGRPQLLLELPASLRREFGVLTKGTGVLTPEQEAYRRKLQGLSVIKDGVRPQVLRDLLQGTKTPAQVETELEGVWAEVEAAAGRVKQGKEWLLRKLLDAEDLVDSFYRIALYEDTLATLQAARAEGAGELEGRALKDFDDVALEQEAARIVLATTPSHSQTMPVVSKFTKSGLGLLVAPFFRFRTEMIRTPINTFQLARAEMASGNSVLEKRGRDRLIGVLGMLGLSATLPLMLSKLLAGIGGEEDDALRKGMPSYLRNNSFFYFRWGKDRALQSLDLTYVNPYSVLSDPLARALGKTFAGDPAGGAAQAVTTLVFDPFMDDQIFAGAIRAFAENKDPATDKPIWEPGIDGADAAWKAAKFLAHEAFTPRVLADAMKAFQAAQGDSSRFNDNPAMILINGALPARVYPIDVESSLRRYLFEKRQQYDRVAQSINRANSPVPLSDDAVRALYQNRLEGKKKVNEDVYQTVFGGYVGLGLTPQAIERSLKDLGYGTARRKLLRMGLMDRDVLTPEFRTTLRAKGEWGVARMALLDEEIAKTPRMLVLD